MYGEGISKTGELLKIASDLDIIKKQELGTLTRMRKSGKVLKMLRNTWQITQKSLMRLTIKSVFNFGLIDGEEVTESIKDEAVQADSVNEEVTLDLGDDLEIEIENKLLK